MSRRQILPFPGCLFVLTLEIPESGCHLNCLPGESIHKAFPFKSFSSVLPCSNMQSLRCDISAVLIIQNESLQGKQSGKVKVVHSNGNTPSLGQPEIELLLNINL